MTPNRSGLHGCYLTVWCLAAVLLLFLPDRTFAEVFDVDFVGRRLNVEDRSQNRIGPLVWRGGLELSSGHPEFGGFSGLTISDDGGTFTAVTDQGHWVTAQLDYGAEGDLRGLHGAEIGRLRDLSGAPLKAGKSFGDAEELAPLSGGAILVSFETTPRIWRYEGAGNALAGVPQDFPIAGTLQGPRHRGFESLAAISETRILAVTEDTEVPGGLAAFLRLDGRWQPLTLARHRQFKPTGAALLPDGDLLLLERQFSWLGGFEIRLRRIDQAAIAPGTRIEGKELALLRPPMTVDNFEGVAVRRGPRGETLIYLISDDNFNPLQRTFLVVFELAE